MKNTDLRDPDKTYHKMMLADLKALTPEFFSWESVFQGRRTSGTERNQRRPAGLF